MLKQAALVLTAKQESVLRSAAGREKLGTMVIGSSSAKNSICKALPA